MATRRGGVRGLIVLLFALIGCATGSAAGAGLDLVLTADKSTYAPSEPIVLTIEVVNRGLEPVVLHFRTAQRYDVALRDAANAEVWRWSSGQMFAQMLGEETLPARGTLRYRVPVRRRFPPGRYTALATIAAEGVSISSSLEITVR